MARQFDIASLLRESVKRIKPYSSARDEFTGEASVYLDANENPIGSVGGTRNNRYPDPYQSELKAEISKLKHVGVESIFVGNGSDEAIDLLFKAFCFPGRDKALSIAPSYGMYKVSAEVNDVEIIDITLDEAFQPKVEAILGHWQPNVKILFLCSPNNPTGNLLDRGLITKLLEGFNGIVVIDEAYIDFSSERSWVTELANYPNLVVLQTLSKAWGLANLRIGMLFASPELVKVLNKLKLPYNISGVAQEYALQALRGHVEQKEQMVQEILHQRSKLLEEFASVPCITRVYPTDANFVLVKTIDPNAIYKFLIDKKIVVRNRNNVVLCEGCLRITVGTEAENRELLEALREYK